MAGCGTIDPCGVRFRISGCSECFTHEYELLIRKTKRSAKVYMYIYDINLKKDKVYCIHETIENGKSVFTQNNYAIETILKSRNPVLFVGISITDDGIKLKPKDIKNHPKYEKLKKCVPKIDKHLEHMREVQKFLKKEREYDLDDFER